MVCKGYAMDGFIKVMRLFDKLQMSHLVSGRKKLPGGIHSGKYLPECEFK